MRNCTDSYKNNTCLFSKEKKRKKMASATFINYCVMHENKVSVIFFLGKNMDFSNNAKFDLLPTLASFQFIFIVKVILYTVYLHKMKHT